MRIAVVGAGVSGLVCAHALDADHDVVIYEARDRLGGHTHTVRVEHEGRAIDVDTGFIVFNDRNYRRFRDLLDQLGVESKPAPMTFGVRDDRTGLEYGGATMNTLFAQRRNLFSRRFHHMLRDVLRFFREAPADLAIEPADATLGDYLRRRGYGDAFIEQFIMPMAGAIWSSPASTTLDLPLRFMVRFFQNHGMLQLRDRPEWRTIAGGSNRYVEALERRLRAEIRLSSAAARVQRVAGRVEVETDRGGIDRFDEVVIACHSDQALRLLADATDDERAVLGAIPYQANDVVLHTDSSLMPRNRRAWSAWNARVTADSQPYAAVTYNLTILQSLGTREHLLVSLNQTEQIDPGRILRRLVYDHPVFTLEGERAKARYDEVSGVSGVHYCGAYWFNGFHEDGVRSGLRVAERMGVAV